MQNVLEAVPYNPEKMGRRELINRKELLMMQIALAPGQAVPTHKANSNVHLLVLEGRINAVLGARTLEMNRGDLTEVAYETPMDIQNQANENATFLVMKTPNPSEMKK